MSPRVVLALLVLLAALPAHGRGERLEAALGLWWAEGGAAQVEIQSCGDALCGKVVWLRSPFDEQGCPVRDTENPDAHARGRPMVGVEILRGLRPEASGEGWSGGEIYDPTSGRHYRAAMSLDGPDRLQVRGYLGIRLLGRTTHWTRVQEEPVCRVSH